MIAVVLSEKVNSKIEQKEKDAVDIRKNVRVNAALFFWSAERCENMFLLSPDLGNANGNATQSRGICAKRFASSVKRIQSWIIGEYTFCAPHMYHIL